MPFECWRVVTRRLPEVCCRGRLAVESQAGAIGLERETVRQRGDSRRWRSEGMTRLGRANMATRVSSGSARSAARRRQEVSLSPRAVIRCWPLTARIGPMLLMQSRIQREQTAPREANACVRAVISGSLIRKGRSCLANSESAEPDCLQSRGLHPSAVANACPSRRKASIRRRQRVNGRREIPRHSRKLPLGGAKLDVR